MTMKSFLLSPERCVHKQPNASMCYVCGRDNPAGLKMSFYDDGNALVNSIVTPANHFQGYPGVLHGGVAAAMLDEVVGRSVMAGDHHRFMMTVNMLVKYRHPIPMGDELSVVAHVVKKKGRIAKAEGAIVLSDGTMACEAQLTLADMPLALASETGVESLDWFVDTE